MKKIPLQLSTLLLLLTCFSPKAFAQDTNKTKLIYKDGDRNKGIEKIIFQNEQGAQVGEFDVQANNPYNNLPYTSKKTNNGDIRIFELSNIQAQKEFGLNVSEKANNINLKSHVWVEKNNNYAIVSYNLFGYRESGIEAKNFRKSTIKIIGPGAVENYVKEIDTDSYSPMVSENGRFLCYAFGEETHDVSTNKSGIAVINVISNKTILNLNVLIDFIYYKNEFIIIRAYENEKLFNWIVSEVDGSIYKIDGNFVPGKSTLFESRDGSIKINDLNRYRLK